MAEALASAPRPLNFVGVGNRLRRDDGVGVEVVALLRRELRRAPRDGFKVHPESGSPEMVLSRIPPEEGIIIFDAVESKAEPGTVVCARLADTKYDFFATHNIPLRLVPGVAERKESVFVFGVEPLSIEFGEGLSDAVDASARSLASEVAKQVRAKE